MSDGNNAITIAQLTEQINEKMDRDAGNATLEIMRTGVIEYQHPTEENGWIWYRKYKDGWVEQGGYMPNAANTIVNLPVEMADLNYTANKTINNDYSGNTNGAQWGPVSIFKISTTQIRLNYGNAGNMQSWVVMGLSKQED